MIIKVERFYFGDDYTIGKLFVDDKYLCDTLEPSVSASSHSAVNIGTYQVNLVWSPKFGRYMIRLEVPCRSGILIHAGNTCDDTNGCVLLGKNESVGCLYNSRKYVELLRSKIIQSMNKNNSIVLCCITNKKLCYAKK